MASRSTTATHIKLWWRTITSEPSSRSSIIRQFKESPTSPRMSNATFKHPLGQLLRSSGRSPEPAGTSQSARRYGRPRRHTTRRRWDHHVHHALLRARRKTRTNRTHADMNIPPPSPAPNPPHHPYPMSRCTAPTSSESRPTRRRRIIDPNNTWRLLHLRPRPRTFIHSLFT